MKSFVAALLFSAATLLACAVTAHADDKADIIALYARLQHAMKAQSAEQVLALLSADFTYKDRNGNVLNGKQFTDQITVQKAEIVGVKIMTMKVIKTVITGKTAKVTNEFSWAMEIVDKDGQLTDKGAKSTVKGQHHVMASTGVVENDLEKTPQGWRFLTLNTVNGKITMDGKPMKRRTAQPPPQPSK
jgi:hypothetical protein